MKFGISTLVIVTSVAALLSAIAFGNPIMSTGLIIIVVPTIIGLFISAKMARYHDTNDKSD